MNEQQKEKAAKIEEAFERLNPAHRPDNGMRMMLVESLAKKLSWCDINSLNALFMGARPKR